MRKLGIIGGMGPLATIDLYRKIVELTPAEKDQDHIPVIIDSYPQIEDRTAHIVSGAPSPLPKLIASALRLKNAGAAALLMPCNTAHYFAPFIEKETGLSLIHIAACAADAIKRSYPQARTIGLIATIGTKKGRVYDDILAKRGLAIAEFPESLEKDIMSCIYSGVKAGKTEEYAPLFQRCADTAADLGAEVMIAGCTEIPILLPYIHSKKPFVDATLELAKSAVSFALEK